MRCIYCLNTDAVKKFTKQEHIIPRTLGGISMLPLGLVCDECNESFSKYERRVVYDSLISIAKQFDGPTGRHGKYQSKLHPIQSISDDSVAIGYIEEGGIPHLVPQFLIKNDDTVIFIAEEYSEDTYSSLIKNTKNTPIEKIVRKSYNEIQKDRIHLTYYKEKVFSFSNEDMDKDTETHLIKLIKDGSLEIKESTFERNSSKVSAHQSISYNIDDLGRVICKTAFNLIARYYPHKIFSNEFNSLRKYIRYNEKPPGKEFYFTDSQAGEMLDKLKKKIHVPDNTHTILLINLPGRKDILGIVGLYDNFVFIISSGYDNQIIDFSPFILYVNEFKNRKEYDFLEATAKENEY